MWLSTGECQTSSSKGHYVRAYLLEQQINKCAVCNAFAEHNGLPLTLILDHINGNAENNSRENLRMVCPNCDSQLDTFKGRNAGNGRHLRRERYKKGKSS